jgi:hydroxyacylglutathione hydrolase
VIQFKTFTGGVFDTNCFLIDAPGGKILVDAPQGADEQFSSEPVGLLLLTHGHFDHIADAAAILGRHRCPCAIAPDSLPLVTSRDAFQKYGFALEIEPIQPERLVLEGPAQDFLGLSFDVFEVPGHCPGSLCFYHRESGNLFGGDVLFCGGVGRWDLPGGDAELLFRGIREKIFPLPPETVVHPGHGPSTTIGEERENNPFVRP